MNTRIIFISNKRRSCMYFRRSSMWFIFLIPQVLETLKVNSSQRSSFTFFTSSCPNSHKCNFCIAKKEKVYFLVHFKFKVHFWLLPYICACSSQYFLHTPVHWFSHLTSKYRKKNSRNSAFCFTRFRDFPDSILALAIFFLAYQNSLYYNLCDNVWNLSTY